MSTIISSKDFQDLKTKITHECDRRIYSHDTSTSLKVYGSGTSYDFTTTPTNGGIIDKEDYQKIFEPLQAFNNKFTYNINKKIVEEDEIILATSFITSAYNRPENSTVSDCTQGSCTGLCSTACSTTCTNDCAENCSNNCTGSCTTSCTGRCYTTCTGSCGGCDTTCTANCANSCEVGCTGQCRYSCGTECSHSCGVTCASGCSWSCEGKQA